MLKTTGKFFHHMHFVTNRVKMGQKILQCSTSSFHSDHQRSKSKKISPHILQCSKPGDQCTLFGGMSSSGLLRNRRANLICQSSRHLSDLPTALERVVPQYEGMMKILVDSPPIEFIQNHLITLHSTLGLPWWATILLITCTTRTLITLPCALYQQHILAKLSNLRWEMDEAVPHLKRDANYRVQVLGYTENESRGLYNKAFREKWSELIIRENCHPMKGFVLILTQLPLWISLSASIRNLCYMLPYPTSQALKTVTELSQEGIAWIPNLAVADPYYILPVVMGTCNLINIEFNYMMRVKEPTRLQRISLNVFRGISLLLFPIAAIVPSGMSLYWATSSVFGLFQNILIVSPRVRRFFRIEETETELQHPYRHVFNSMKARIPRKVVETSSIPKKSTSSVRKK